VNNPYFTPKNDHMSRINLKKDMIGNDFILTGFKESEWTEKLL